MASGHIPWKRNQTGFLPAATGCEAHEQEGQGVLPLDLLVMAVNTVPVKAGLPLHRKPDWRSPLAGAAFLHACLLISFLVAPSLVARQQPSLPEVVLVSLATVSELEPDAPPVQPADLRAAPPRPAPVARRAQKKISRPVAASLSPPAAAEVAEKPDHSNTEETAAAPAPVYRDGADSRGINDHASEVSTNKDGAEKKLVQAQPRFRENRPPTYPEQARRRQLEGTVVLEALVSGGGKVDDLAVHASSGHQLLDEAALQAVREWFFEPGRRGGTPVTMKILVPVRFALR